MRVRTPHARQRGLLHRGQSRDAAARSEPRRRDSCWSPPTLPSSTGPGPITDDERWVRTLRVKIPREPAQRLAASTAWPPYRVREIAGWALASAFVRSLAGLSSTTSIRAQSSACRHHPRPHRCRAGSVAGPSAVANPLTRVRTG